MEKLIDKWFDVLFVIYLPTVNKLFSYTDLFEDIYNILLDIRNKKSLLLFMFLVTWP